MPLKGLGSAPLSGGRPRQVTLSSAGGRNSADGGNVPPSVIFTTMGILRAAGGAEFDKAQSIAQTCRHILRLPYQPGIAENMIVGYENRTFQINYIAGDDEMRFWLDLYCSEIGQNAGSQT